MARKVSEEVWNEMITAIASAKGHTSVSLSTDHPWMAQHKQDLHDRLSKALNRAITQNEWVPE